MTWLSGMGAGSLGNETLAFFILCVFVTSNWTPHGQLTNLIRFLILAITGLGYMLLFDAFGVLNIFISSVIHTDINMKKSTVKHPFG